MNNVDQVYKTIQADKKVPSDIRKAGPFDALVLVAKARNTKHAVAILNCFNRLLATDGVDQGQLKDIIDGLAALAHTSQDIQVKVLQTLPLFLTSVSYTLAGQQLATCLEIPIGLLNVSGIVGSIASATLQQMLVSLFDSPPQSRESDVSRIFEDLCSGLAGGEAGYISFEAVKNGLLLELLESILIPKSRLFETHPSLVDANLLATVLTLVQDETTSHSLLIRALRLCSLLYASKTSLLESILKFLPKAQLHRQVLILESIESSMKDLPQSQYPHIVSTMLLFEDSILGLGTYSICFPPRVADEQFTAEGLVYTDTSNLSPEQEGIGEWCRPSRRLIAQSAANDCPKFSSGYRSLLLLNILAPISLAPENIWRDTLVLHSAFLSSCLSLAMEKQVLDGISTVIQKLNAMEDKKPRDLYLRRLGRIAVSSSLQADEHSTPVTAGGSTGELVHRSFSCLFRYLETVTLLRDFFNVRAWAQILDILSTADSLLTMKTRRSSRQTGSLMGAVLSDEKVQVLDTQSASDISRLSAYIEGLFKTSDQISNESFAALIEALCSMHVGIPGSPLTATPSASRVSSPHRRLGSVSSMTSFSLAFQTPAETHSFPLQRLMDLLPANVPRFTDTEAMAGWDHLLAFLTDEIHAGSAVAAEVLGMTIVKACQSGLHTKAHQVRFVYALEAISGEGPILLLQLESLASTLEILGHELLCGWDLILRILYSSITQGPSSDADVVRLGFSCLQLICTDFIGSIPHDQLALLIETIVCFASQKEALNIALSAIGHFWTVLRVLPKQDFDTIYTQFPEELKNESSKKDELLWLLLMENLIFMTQDIRPEVRNSSIQACFRLVSTTETIGATIWLSSVHLLLRDLQTIPGAIDPQSEGYIETVNIITAGTNKSLLSALELRGLTDQTLAVWKLCVEHLRVVSISTRVETAASALSALSELFMDSRRFVQPDDARLTSVNWQTVQAIGNGIYTSDTTRMSQEGIATYLAILLRLLEDQAIPNSAADITTLLELTYRGLTYARSTTYYVDIDYLSNTQKPVLSIMTLLLEQYHKHRQLILSAVARALRLAPENEASQLASSSGSTSIWKGRPTHLMLVVKMQELVAQHYNIDDDSDLSAMSRLIEALNYTIKIRYVKSSVADKSLTHNLWISATNQVLNFIRLLHDKLDSVESLLVWDQILDSSSHLFTSHADQSEEFVLATLNSLRALLGPHLSKQKTANIERYAEALYHGSWFYEQAELIVPSTVPASYYKDQILREWCFLELYKLSIQTLNVTNGELKNHAHIAEGDACANVTLTYAIRRAQNILHRYINNAQLRANAPLPQIEYAELLLLLDHLSDETINHANQRVLLKSVYTLVVEALVVNHSDAKVLKLLKDTLMRVGDLL